MPEVIEGLAHLATHDTEGLGAEAARTEAWRAGRKGLRLCRSANGQALLVDDAADGVELSAPFARALDRLGRFFSLVRLGPDDAPRLRRALLSEHGIAAVRGLFEASIEQRVRGARRELVPEVHGHATLADGAIRFHALPNPLTALVRRLRAAGHDRAALARLYEAEAAAMRLLDETGAFRRFLFETLPAWEAADRPAIERRRAMIDYHLDTMAEESATVIARGTLADNLRLMVGQDWSGGYVGIWHTHPPALVPGRFVGEPEHLRGPSEADIELALRAGQNLTLAFVEDGFDAWDLAGLRDAADAASPQRLIRHRAEAWREYFRELRRRLAD